MELLNLESQNQAENIPVGLPSSRIKIWGKSHQEFLSYNLYMYLVKVLALPVDKNWIFSIFQKNWKKSIF